MNIRLKLVLFVLFLGFLSFAPGKIHAATYYVDATLGLDSNNGTDISTPWQTFSKINATTTFVAGDIILFKRGETFAGGINARFSGTSGNPITFGAYGTGADPIINSSGRSYGIDIQTKSYIRFENLNIQNATTGQFLILGTLSGIEIDNVTTSGGVYGIYELSGTKTGLSITDTTITNTTYAGITLSGINNDITLTNVTVSSGVRGIYLPGTVADIDISSSNFSNLTGYGFIGETYASITTMTIDQSHFDSNTTAGFYMPGNITGLTITNSFFNSNTGASANGLWIAPAAGKVAQTISVSDTQANDNGSKGIYLSSASTGYGTNVTFDNITAEDNTSLGFSVQHSWNNLTITDSTFDSNGSDGVQFYLSSSSSASSNIDVINVVTTNNSGSGFQFIGTTGAGSDVLMQNVTVSNNAHDGINVKGNWTDINVSGCLVEENGTTGLDSDGDGISYHNSTTGTIKYCRINNNLKSAVAHVGDTDLDMSYNVFTHDTNGVIALVHLEGTGTYNLFNNVIYSAGQTGTGIDSNAAVLTIKNNIVYGFDQGVDIESGTTTEDYNIIYNYGTSSLTGITMGSNSLLVDPLFVNAVGNDFSLRSTSPARDTGLAISATYDDALHPTSVFVSSITTVDQDLRGAGWEIGAYAYPVPQAPTVVSGNTLSSSSIDITITDNSSDETGFSVYSSSDALAQTIATANLSTVEARNLISNTGFYLKTYNSYGESVASSGSIVYTFAQVPPGISSVVANGSSITIQSSHLPNETVGSSGYYFTNTTTGANSGWIQTSIWKDTTTVCENTYTYSVKYRSSQAIETSPIVTPISIYSGSCGFVLLPLFDGTGIAVPSLATSTNTGAVVPESSENQPTITLGSTDLFTLYMRQGSRGPEVKKLQIFLNSFQDTQLASAGPGSQGQETEFFGPLTRSAVIKFQEKYTGEILSPWGATRGTGYFYKTTMAKANRILQDSLGN